MGLINRAISYLNSLLTIKNSHGVLLAENRLADKAPGSPECFGLKRYIVKNFFWRGLQTFGKQGLFFIVFTIGARLLPQQNFGIYNYVMASVMLLTLFCDFGISKATSRHIAMSRELKIDSYEETVFNMSLLSLLVGFLVLIFLVFFGKIFFGSNYVYILYASPLIFLVSFASIQEGLFMGLEKFKKLSIIILVSGVLNILTSYVLIKKFGISGAILGQVLFYITESALLMIFHGRIAFKFKKRIIYTIGKYSLIIGISGLGYFLFSRIDIVILGHFGFIKQIANYEIINKLFAILITPATIISSVVGPRIALLFAKKESKEIWSSYKKTLLLTGVGSALILVVSFLFFNFIIRILFPGYSIMELKRIFLIISILLMSQSLSTVISAGFSISTGHAKLNMVFLLVFGTLSIPANLLAVNTYGFAGVLYTTLMIKLLSDLLYIYKYTRILYASR